MLFSGHCFPVESLEIGLPDWTGNTCLDFSEHGDGRNEDLVMLWCLVSGAKNHAKVPSAIMKYML